MIEIDDLNNLNKSFKSSQIMYELRLTSDFDPNPSKYSQQLPNLVILQFLSTVTRPSTQDNV